MLVLSPLHSTLHIPYMRTPSEVPILSMRDEDTSGYDMMVRNHDVRTMQSQNGMREQEKRREIELSKIKADVYGVAILKR